jgi:hypothetical protein
MELEDDLAEQSEGNIGLKKLGHLLIGYLARMGGHATAPARLAITERSADPVACAACGRAVNGGEFTLARREDGLDAALPFLAVHALASHGVARYEGGALRGEAPVGELVEILNYEVYARGKMLSRYLSHTVAPPAHLLLEQRPERGYETCAECGEQVNMGSFVIENAHTHARMELRFIALHAMAWHKDRRYKGSLHEGGIDLLALRTIMDHSEAYAAIGRALEGYLRAMGGKLPVSAAMTIEEHPVRSREGCGACRAEVNAGTWKARSNANGAEIALPYFAVHSLAAHGDAYFKGSLHQGWIDMALLARVMG